VAASGDGPPLHEALAEQAEVREHLDAEEIRRLLEPTAYLGVTGDLIDRALRAHHDRTEVRA
jgi:hypothetical protein